LNEYFVDYSTVRPHQSLGYSALDEVYRSGQGGGAHIVYRYRLKNALKQELVEKEGSAFPLHKQLVTSLNSAPFCLLGGVHYTVGQLTKSLLSIPRWVKLSLAMAFDVMAAVFTAWIAFSFRYAVWHEPAGYQWVGYLLPLLLVLPFFLAAGVYKTVFRYSGFDVLQAVAKAVLWYGTVFFAVLVLFRFPDLPRTVGVMQPILLLLVSGGGRALLRVWLGGAGVVSKRQAGVERILIYGAGSAGLEIAEAIIRSSRFFLAGFVDDDQQLQGRMIMGMRVYRPDEAEKAAEEGDVSGLLLAMPSESRSRRMEVVERFRKYPLHIQMLPGLEALADGSVSISDLKEVEIEDLLGRDPLPVDEGLLERHIAGKVVMVTGAGGSIGSELCRQLLSAGPASLVLLDNSEYALYAIHAELGDRVGKSGGVVKLYPLLGDVADERRMVEICRKHAPAIIYHAAAYKHVPLVEANPLEGVRNNIIGTLGIARAVLACGVPRMVLVSTDKAVRPTNVMGASKRVCEMLLQALAAEAGQQACFSMVRFGNVLGSSGSVVPLFREQIRRGGPVTVTHEAVTRYFMTIPEAAQLVVQAGAMASGGEVFLLDMGEPVRILELARRMVELSGLSVREESNPGGDIEIIVIGLRSGEKLYEELLIGDQSLPTANPRIFNANEEFLTWPEMVEILDRMVLAMAKGDVAGVSALLKGIVAGFQQETAGERGA